MYLQSVSKGLLIVNQCVTIVAALGILYYVLEFNRINYLTGLKVYSHFCTFNIACRQ